MRRSARIARVGFCDGVVRDPALLFACKRATDALHHLLQLL
jgi:hypothetical protein